MARVRPNGGVVGPPITVSGTSASGMFSIVEAVLDKQAGNFPAYVPIVVAEPQFNLTSLLLHGDGSNSANNNTFLDASTNAFAITRNGTPTQGTFSPFSQTGWSNYFNGSTDYLTLPYNSALDLTQVSIFTLEAWVYCTAFASVQNTIMGNRRSGGTGWEFRINPAGTVTYYHTGGASITSSATISLNTWNHIAAVRNGSTLYVCVNGVVTSGAISNGTATTNIPAIGVESTTGDYHYGYISNLRILSGTALYTTTFTPPTAPLTAVSGTVLLTCQSNRFVDNSTNGFTLTPSGSPSVQSFSPFPPAASYGVSGVGGSMYFNGSTDYLSAPNNSAFLFGASDFTIECWVYLPNVTAENDIFSMWGSSGNRSFLCYVVSSRVAFAYTTNGSTSTIIQSGGVMSTNTWSHLAWVRSGATITLYLNGTSVASGAAGTLYNTTNPFWIGYDPGTYTNGYISNVRVVKGTAVYTSNFTPPTAPVTAIANTTLLVNGTNAGVYDSTAKNVITTAGTAVISTAQSKFGGSSIYFATSGDGLTIPANSLLSTFSTGNFTIEFWMRYTTPGAVIADLIRSTTWAIVDYSNGNLYWQNAYASSSLLFYNHGSLSDGNWHHVAVVRSATSTLTMYVDGTAIGSGTDSNSYNTNSAVTIGIGGSYGQFLGYMDEIRITKYARYTSNFTPTTSAFLNQ